MSVADCLMLQELYGLFKINQAGVIQAFQSGNDSYSKAIDPFINGQNIFEEILPFDKILAFSRRIENFRSLSGWLMFSKTIKVFLLILEKLTPPNFKNKEQGNGYES